MNIDLDELLHELSDANVNSCQYEPTFDRATKPSPAYYQKVKDIALDFKERTHEVDIDALLTEMELDSGLHSLTSQSPKPSPKQSPSQSTKQRLV